MLPALRQRNAISAKAYKYTHIHIYGAQYSYSDGVYNKYNAPLGHKNINTTITELILGQAKVGNFEGQKLFGSNNRSRFSIAGLDISAGLSVLTKLS